MRQHNWRFIAALAVIAPIAVLFVYSWYSSAATLTAPRALRPSAESLLVEDYEASQELSPSTRVVLAQDQAPQEKGVAVQVELSQNLYDEQAHDTSALSSAIHGVVRLDEEPHRGAQVTLAFLGASENFDSRNGLSAVSLPEFSTSGSSNSEQGTVEFFITGAAPKTGRSSVGSHVQKLTGKSGKFSFDSLKPGRYLCWVQSADGRMMVSRSFDLQPAQNRNVGFYDLSSITVDPVLTAVLYILSDLPFADVSARGQTGAPRSVGKTDVNGEFDFQWASKRPIQIDLLGPGGTLLGSSQEFKTYPAGIRSRIIIEASYGSLAIALAAGTEVLPGEVMIYRVLRRGQPKSKALVQSVYGNRADGSKNGVSTRLGGIEIASLQAGIYEISVTRKTIQNLRWAPFGAELKALVEVRPKLEAQVEM
jgi:hypothetical protein